MATEQDRPTKPSLLELLADIGLAAAVIGGWLIITRLAIGTPFTPHRLAVSGVLVVVLGTLVFLLRRAYDALKTSQILWRTGLREISQGIGIVGADRSTLRAFGGYPERSVGDGKASLVVLSDATGSSQGTRELRDELASLRVQLRESAHRTKNNLQMVASLVSLADPGHDTEALSSLEQRIRLMGLVHEQLTTEENDGPTSLQGFLSFLSRGIVDSVTPPSLQLSLICSAPEWEVPARRAVSLGLIINELITNSIKHGYAGRDSGRIEIHGVVDDEFLELRYTDDGNGYTAAETTSSPGSGIQLVRLIVSQLGGVTAEQEPSAGYQLGIRIPVRRLN